MSSGDDLEVWQAGACAALGVDLVTHPLDTLITRIQSPMYKTYYKTVTGSFNRTFFKGLYQGFGPTIITGIPSSAVFFAIYESLKTASQDLKSAGHLPSIPLPILYGLSSAAADLVSCAIINPAEVLKQNAQVHSGRALSNVAKRSPILAALKHFAKHPTRLWAGYTALAASNLPATSLTFCLYEMIKERIFSKYPQQQASTSRQVSVSSMSGALAGGFACVFFVPIDIVKTRMRLAAGNVLETSHRYSERPSVETQTGFLKSAPSKLNLGPLGVARGIMQKDGIRGLFRGATMSFIASALGAGLYLGSYEAFLIYFNEPNRVSSNVAHL
ncbi:mitochondrial carrier protein [Colletotrichum truncatum]|uniref:Mitochondrial carrier protein n=1 Tax=Colletotrichum truncatum TaxID=5467 RepID=A0ACC3YVI2_COLTU|nr:mitochondrial carrier protein [Colletotrichum truncatum]KAF6781587.1 mitochondrial carrier protein [Colletotrichum truncatum]